jgi:putative transposase
LPEGDKDYSVRWALIKKEFIKMAKHYVGVIEPTPTQQKRGEGTIWQRRFWEHMIRDDHDFSNHFDYIHFNAVKHGLVKASAQWPYSTFHRYVDDGVYSMDWGAFGVDVVMDVAGE